MTAIRLRFRAELRSRWRTWLALTVIAGFAGGLAVALVAAADRTRTALGRFEVAVHGADAYVDPGFGFGEEDLNLGRVAALPQVVASEPTAHLTVISRSRDGHAINPVGSKSVEYLAPMDGRRQDSIDRPKLLQGRLPDPTVPDEMLGDSRALKFAGVHVGDTMALRLVSHDLLWHDAQNLRLSVDPVTASRWGPLVRVKVVGVSANARTDVDGGQFHLSPAFYPAHGGRQLGSWINELPVRLRHGSADLPAFKAGVDRIAGDLSYGFFDPSLGRPQVQRSMALQGWALEILAGFWSAAALLLIAQMLYRQSAADSSDRATLRALGMTRGQQLRLAAARSVLIAVPATVLALLFAFMLSPLAPIGRAREIDPDVGFHVHRLAFGAGAAVVLFTVLLVSILSSWHAQRTTAGDARPKAGLPWVATLRRAGFPPVMLAGLRMALQRRTAGSPVPVRATLLAAILALAVTGTALTFAASVQHLLRTPRLYGQNWDFESGPPPASPSFLRRLKADPAIAGLAVGAGAYNPPVDINGHMVGVRAVDNVIGAITPTVIEGRAPRTTQEILLGTKTLQALKVHIGDSVTVRRGQRSTSLKVVGRGVLPAGKAIKLGEGAAMSFTALKRVDPQAIPDISVIELAPGADRKRELAKLTLIFDGSSAVRPQRVTDFGGVSWMPFLIAGLFAAAAAGALAHALITSIRRRRRDLAVMKTLGFTRAQVVASVAWQATTVAALGVLIGLPLGLAVGRFAYNVFAENLGVLPDAVTPLGATLLVIPAAVVIANLVASLPSWSAAQTRPAVVLRAE